MMKDFMDVQLGEAGEVRVEFRSPLFRNLVAGLPVLWKLLADLRSDSGSNVRRRLFGSPHAEAAEENFWQELMVPELEGELRSDREIVFREIGDWAGPEDVDEGTEAREDRGLVICSDSVGAWIGVLGQVRLMISEETGVSEEELGDSGLSDRRRALVLGQWVYGALLEELMPHWG